MIYAIDSNIISYFLKKDEIIRNKIRTEIENDNYFIIPPIVYFEVKRWLVLKQANAQMREFERLCEKITIGEMNRFIWEKAIEIYVSTRKTGNVIDDSDVFIAAFCIVNDCELVTNNLRHFECIKDLKYINWKC
ncbi:MAG: PIN domain-containing protein [Oscillospiraceae bacterium]|nr:PIN domain-containing protein [Oscillospiraceae bacterium]